MPFCRRHPYGQVYLAHCGTAAERQRSQNIQMKADATPTAAAAEPVVSETDDSVAAVEDDESNLLKGRGSGNVAVSAEENNSDLSLRQRLRLIAALLRGPLLPSAAAVAGNFGITLALFPGVLTEMRSANKSFDDWCAPNPPLLQHSIPVQLLQPL